MGVCLTNDRPMIVIAGGFDQDQGGMGGFQEWNQVCIFVFVLSLGIHLMCKLVRKLLFNVLKHFLLS